MYQAIPHPARPTQQQQQQQQQQQVSRMHNAHVGFCSLYTYCESEVTAKFGSKSALNQWQANMLRLRLTSDAHVSSLVSRGTDASHKGGVRRSNKGLSLVGLTSGTHESSTVL